MAKKYRYKNGWHTCAQLAKISGMTQCKLNYRIKINGGFVTERVMNSENLSTKSGQPRTSKETHDGMSVSSIAIQTGLTYTQIRGKIKDGLTAEQILYGVFGSVGNGKSILYAWDCVFSNFRLRR